MTRRLLLAVLLCAATTPAFAGWGPSWVGGGPPGGFPRPADLKEPTTAVSVRGDESGFAVEASVWGDLPVTGGHEYHLYYQLRVHTEKGETGPVIDLGGKTGGTPFFVAKGTVGDDWNGLEGRSDITRKELSGAAGWPEVKKNESETVFVRVEPQLFDATDKKYITPGRTRAFILVARVGEGRKVQSLHTLARWIEDNGRFSSAKVVEVLGGLDEYDPAACGVAEAMVKPLSDKDTKKEAKLKLVGAVPPAAVADRKASYSFVALMEEWAKGDDAELKEAAVKVLGER
jgi:hypothetical protein